VQQQESPERLGNGLQRQKSLGKRWKELVIDCISPNTKQVRLGFTISVQFTSLFFHYQWCPHLSQ